ncbi:MAG TPA: group I intron-associated PD-(D/E)XK endonuclease [Jatrophihabitans sp.]|nr:group I intron-associated PD-(D/E)XK endonuclease [Jatrophihabitans sp.]
MTATSAGSMRAARRRADALGLDYTHFTGQRTWSDRELARALASATTWAQALDALGLASNNGRSLATVRAHALRLGLATEHLKPVRPRTDSPAVREPRLEYLRRAGPLLAAAWFTLRGYEVAWPLEPCRYDLVVTADARHQRVQVKTTAQLGCTAGTASISSSRDSGRAVYGPDEVDLFFVIDHELNAFLIPLAAVAGYTRIQLNHYGAYQIAERGQWLTAITAARAASPGGSAA